MSSTLTFDIVLFREKYPEFTDPPYTDEQLQQCWNTATCYISDQDCGKMQGDCRETALNLMTAHLCKIANLASTGSGVSELTQSATIDKVSVTQVTPPVRNQWQWWLSTTIYGQQLFALLQAKSVGGFYSPGLPETSAFRRVGGVFL
jgi:hypothetical protein